MIDMSPPAFLWLSSGLRACGEPSKVVAQAGIITGSYSTFKGPPLTSLFERWKAGFSNRYGLKKETKKSQKMKVNRDKEEKKGKEILEDEGD
jgi:hypothetical protein